MKKVIALVCALLLLCGCSQEERVPCVHCGEPVARGVPLGNGDTVCGDCFADHGYLVCLDCGTGFDPDHSIAAQIGYCDECGQESVGFCERCDNLYPREQMYDENGEYYLCAQCKNEDLTEIIEDPSLFKFTVDDYYDAYGEGFDEGYNLGYEVGYEEGYTAGNEAGTKTGHDAGFEEGYKAGHEDGRKEGYNSGYDAGISTAASVTKASNNVNSSNSSASSSSTSSQPQSVTVYITKTGSKYHRSGCQYLSKSKIAISLDDAKSRGYTACSRCW